MSRSADVPRLSPALLRAAAALFAIPFGSALGPPVVPILSLDRPRRAPEGGDPMSDTPALRHFADLVERADQPNSSFGRGEISRAIRAVLDAADEAVLPLPRSVFWAREFQLKANGVAHSIAGTHGYECARDGSTLRVVIRFRRAE